MPTLNVPEEKLNKYLNKIRDSYRNWGAPSSSRLEDPFRKEMIEEFDAGLRYEIGSKYIKIITHQNSVHSFIVNTTKAKFPIGSLLKAASWKTPATNFSRGNILDIDTLNIPWTGV